MFLTWDQSYDRTTSIRVKFGIDQNKGIINFKCFEFFTHGFCGWIYNDNLREISV